MLKMVHIQLIFSTSTCLRKECLENADFDLILDLNFLGNSNTGVLFLGAFATLFHFKAVT